MISSTKPSGSDPPVRRMSTATRTFSRTDSSENSSRRWNVRAIPWRARFDGFAREMSSPARSTRPCDGGSSPVITLKSVVLPAPFGPMRPVTAPSDAVRSTPSSAVLPPNRTVTPRTSSSALRDIVKIHLVHTECAVDLAKLLVVPGFGDAEPFERHALDARRGRVASASGADEQQSDGPTAGEDDERPVRDHVADPKQPRDDDATDDRGGDALVAPGRQERVAHLRDRAVRVPTEADAREAGQHSRQPCEERADRRHEWEETLERDTGEESRSDETDPADDGEHEDG